MENIEYKAELRDPELAEGLLIRIGGVRVAVMKQSDTCFRLADGRLTKRRCDDEPTEWIHYHREPVGPVRLSRFTIYTEREARVRFGERQMPVWLIVNKTRDMWVQGPLRVHFDDVVGVGRFVEIEALVTPRRPADECRRAVLALRQTLAPALGEAIMSSYADLMSRVAA